MKKSDQVFEVHGRKCVYCGEKATTVDHLKPVSIGGTDEFDNLVPCCTTCNPRKGSRVPEEYIRAIALRGARNRITAILEDAQRRIIVEINDIIRTNIGNALFAMEGLERARKEKVDYYKGGDE